METIKMEDAVNKFLTDYCRIFNVNNIAFREMHRRLRKELLCGCIFLQQCFKDSPGGGKGDYLKVQEALEEFVTTEIEDKKEYCILMRWFPSVAGGESSFLEFSRLLWVEQHYFEEEERRKFEDVILNIWVQFHDINQVITIMTSEKNRQKLAVAFCKEEGSDLNVESLRASAIAYLDDLLEKYYLYLYVGKRLYAAKRDKEMILEDWRECVYNAVKESSAAEKKEEETDADTKLE